MTVVYKKDIFIVDVVKAPLSLALHLVRGLYNMLKQKLGHIVIRSSKKAPRHYFLSFL